MKLEIKNAIESYQCPGCVVGSDITCFEKADNDKGCNKHVAGTMIFPIIGKIFLGMSKGFNRIGSYNEMPLQIFEYYEDFGYNHLNIPVWKHLNENGHTLIRGISPRINKPFLHVILEDCMEKVNCIDAESFLNQID